MYFVGPRNLSAAVLFVGTLVIPLNSSPTSGSLATPQARSTQTGYEPAERLFDEYVRLERAFDPALAKLYADDAVIRNRRVYPDGQTREITIPTPQYKEMIRKLMPVARARGDVNRYSNCTYEKEGERVWIRCTRYSELKRYSSPISLLVGPAAGSGWRILMELSESRP